MIRKVVSVENFQEQMEHLKKVVLYFPMERSKRKFMFHDLTVKPGQAYLPIFH